jgi:hypothetical protein
MKHELCYLLRDLSSQVPNEEKKREIISALMERSAARTTNSFLF